MTAFGVLEILHDTFDVAHFLFWNIVFIEILQMLSIFELALLLSDYNGNFLNVIPLLKENKERLEIVYC